MFREAWNEREDQSVCASRPAWLSCAPSSSRGWSRAPLGGLSLATAYEQNQAWEMQVKLSLPWGGGFSLFSWTPAQLCHQKVLQRRGPQSLKATTSTPYCSPRNFPDLKVQFPPIEEAKASSAH